MPLTTVDRLLRPSAAAPARGARRRATGVRAAWTAAVLVAAAAPLAATAAEPWTIDGRCVAQLCVGDTVYTARRSLPAAVLRSRTEGFELVEGGRPVLRLTVEDGPEAPSDASRIARIEVLRPGTRTGVADTALGDPAERLQKAGPGQWLAGPGKARWWSVERPSPPGVRPYPVSFGIDSQARVVSAVLNGGDEREAAYPDLDTALRASQARLLALQPALALLPTRGPALAAKGPVFADLALSRDGVVLRISSRADCDSAACEILTADVGPGARDDGGTEALKLPDGTPAHWQPVTCGGSCAPALLSFERQGRPVRLSLATGFTTPSGTPADPARDRRLLLDLAASIARQP